MVHVQYSDIIVATIAAVLFSAVYYIILNRQVVAARATIYAGERSKRPSMTVTKLTIEIVRTFVVGLFVAYAIALLNLLYIQQAVMLALWLWIAFPVVLLVGSVVHEKLPVKLAIIHAGDWLVKLAILVVILTLWR